MLYLSVNVLILRRRDLAAKEISNDLDCVRSIETKDLLRTRRELLVVARYERDGPLLLLFIFYVLRGKCSYVDCEKKIALNFYREL